MQENHFLQLVSVGDSSIFFLLMASLGIICQFLDKAIAADDFILHGIKLSLAQNFDILIEFLNLDIYWICMIPVTQCIYYLDFVICLTCS